MRFTVKTLVISIGFQNDAAAHLGDDVLPNSSRTFSQTSPAASDTRWCPIAGLVGNISLSGLINIYEPTTIFGVSTNLAIVSTINSQFTCMYVYQLS